jgi:hypothetical protein
MKSGCAWLVFASMTISLRVILEIGIKIEITENL